MAARILSFSGEGLLLFVEFDHPMALAPEDAELSMCHLEQPIDRQQNERESEKAPV